MRSNNKVVLNYVHKNNLLDDGLLKYVMCPLADTIFKETLWRTLLSFSKARWYIFDHFYLEIVTLFNPAIFVVSLDLLTVNFLCKQFFFKKYMILPCQRQQSLYIFMLILKIQMFSFRLTSQCNTLCEAMRF